MNGNLFIIVRGKPASGKSSIINCVQKMSLTQFDLIDPDLVDINSSDFKQFRARQTKNPAHNVKMYCFLFDLAEKKLRQNKNVVWCQPWSRQAEVDLTIRNFCYYFTSLKDGVWKENIQSLIKLLPFKVAIVEVDTANDEIIKRFKKRGYGFIDKEKLARLCRTLKMHQDLNFHIDTLNINGNLKIEENAKIVNLYLLKLSNQ